jgi:[ribosomal protein S5]-alanine N-acetyltransferase
MLDVRILRTSRLTLRPFALDDADDLFGVRGDAEAMRYWDWPADANPAATWAISGQFVEEMAAGSAFYWAARTSAGRFAGLFDLNESNGEVPDLGFMVPRPLWGKGFGFEAASAVVGEGWRRGIAGLQARVHDGNERSARLLAKIGFSEVGTQPMQVRPGVMILCRHFRLLRPDYGTTAI